MASPRFEFRSHLVQMKFALGREGLREVRERATTRNDQLNLNHLASTDSALLLQSPTGSTEARITADQGTLTTRFFGSFVELDANDKRAEYAEKKQRLVLDMLAGAGASLQYIGVSVVARASVAQVEDPGVLQKAALHATGLHDDWTEREPSFDFSVRVSRRAEHDTFSNIHLHWYQDRRMTIEIGRDSSLPPSRKDIWELPLVDEGLEFRYDRNNKRGLFAGRKDWSREDFLRIADDTIRGAPTALLPFTERMSDHTE